LRDAARLLFPVFLTNRFAALLVLCSASFAAESVPARVPGVPVTGNLLPAASATFQIASEGDFRILLEQGDWDFTIDILEPERRAPRRTVDGFGYGLEPANLVRGPALVRIRRVDTDALPAAFTPSIAAIPDAWRTDAEVWMRAEDGMTAARAMGKRGSAANKEKAVKLSREALRLWEQTGERDAILRSS
jgi:hypothetical protein